MSLLNDLEMHTVQLSRLATELLKTGVYPSYDAAYQAVRLILLDAEQMRSQAALNRVSKAIEQAIRASTDEGWGYVTDQLNELAVYESSYYAKLIGGYANVKLAVPPKKQIADWMQKALMALEQGQRTRVGTWPEYMQANQGSFIEAVLGVVKKGYMDGATGQEMVRTLRPMVDGLLKNEASALVRTAVQFYANQARQEMMDANDDIIVREVPLVVMDNRTSDTCRNIDVLYHKGWPKGENPIGIPPYHFGCRTVLVGLVEGQEIPDGMRPSIGAKDTEEARKKFEERQERIGDKKVKYRGKRDLDIFEIKKISPATTYEQFLRAQPMYFIEDVLGKTRAKLFVEGKLPLSKFTDMSGRTLTLAELRDRDAAVFARLGIK